MEAGRAWFNRLWRNPVGTVLLYGSMLLHFLLALLRSTGGGPYACRCAKLRS